MPNAPSAKPSNLRLVLVDDTVTFRELLKEALKRRFNPRELLDFSRVREATAACIESPPDLLIVDLYLPDGDGRDVVRELRRRGLNTRVLALTGHPEARLPADLISLGVAGFVDKNSPIEQIERAVQRVLEGGMFFSASVPPLVPELSSEPALPSSGPEVLSPREREVVSLVVRGLASKQVGSELNLSTRTVEKHRARIMAKLGVRDVPTLVRWSLRNGLG
jgi:DNA-binding NarL/FixJ family response regulator